MVKNNSMKGHVKYNNFGSKMIVSEDRGNKDIDVYFPEYDWTAEHRERSEFRRCTIRCPYEPRVFGVGYLGEGKYKTTYGNGKQNKCYMTWKHMLQRCYDKKYQENKPTYKGCKVCKAWHNFQVFAKWYYENIYFINNERMHLDKDILFKGNKIYSPETCVFVPQRINSLFTKSNRSRGEYPIGISYNKNKDKLEVCCSIYKNKNNNKINKHIGTFLPDQVDEAFLCYKQFKEAYIKEVAEEYKELIPEKLYQALINYEIEIDD